MQSIKQIFLLRLDIMEVVKDFVIEHLLFLNWPVITDVQSYSQVQNWHRRSKRLLCFFFFTKSFAMVHRYVRAYPGYNRMQRRSMARESLFVRQMLRTI